MLGEAGMTTPGVDIGNEDRMTYVGANGKVQWGRDCDDGYFPDGCGRPRGRQHHVRVRDRNVDDVPGRLAQPVSEPLRIG